MTSLLLLVVSVAALDALNPSTVAPAFVLATGRRPLRALTAFVGAVFAVSTIGGLVLTLGPVGLVLRSLARPSAHARHVGELVVGAVFLAVAAVLWRFRGGLARRAERVTSSHRSAGVAGATIMAVELPTAVPYFGAMVAIVNSRRSWTIDVLLILLYNVVFVLPLLVLMLARFASRGRTAWLDRLQASIYRFGPTVVPIGFGVVGAVLVAVGATGL